MAKSMYIPEGEPVTEFNGDAKGMALMDTHEGIARKNSRMWQIIALISMSAFFISLFVLVWAVKQPKTVPVIVTVNESGQAHYVGKLDISSSVNSNTVPDVHKEAQIIDFIGYLFNVVTDENVQDTYVYKAGKLVQGGATDNLRFFYREHNPYETLGKRTQKVTVEPPLKQSTDTYVTYFNVETKTLNGVLVDYRRYSILTTLGYYNMTVENPLGVYITNFDVTEVKETRR